MDTHRVLLLGLILLLPASGGCATIVAGHWEQVSFQVEDGSDVTAITVDGMEYKVPCSVPLSRDFAHRVRLGDSREFVIGREFNDWVWGNILIGGIIGAVVDAASGAWNQNLEPDSFVFRVDGSVTDGHSGTIVLPRPDQMAAWLEERRKEKMKKEAKQKTKRIRPPRH